MLYETVSPFTMREPGGTIEVAGARYTAIDERNVRVEGSRFEPAGQYTVKLEGAAVTGYETMSFAGIRDPLVVRSIDVWAKLFTKTLTERVENVLELASAHGAPTCGCTAITPYSESWIKHRPRLKK